LWDFLEDLRLEDFLDFFGDLERDLDFLWDFLPITGILASPLTILAASFANLPILMDLPCAL